MKLKNIIKRTTALFISICMTTTFFPVENLMAQDLPEVALENKALHVGVSQENGAFVIRTTEGNKVSKEDDGKKLLFEMDDDHTSFVTFSITRGDKTKEYIFGGSYPFANSTNVKVSKNEDTINSEWSVDGVTFTQSIKLVNSGSNEHGMAYISYTAKNSGDPAQIKCRLLMDTALGDQDYGYYSVGDANNNITKETKLDTDGYDKSFYVMDNPIDPKVVAYTVNASIDKKECKPYKTIFAHWAALASCKFDYNINPLVNFTTVFNGEHLTADSATALYFDMGSVDKDKSSVIATNYGVYSNEGVKAENTAAINIVAPDYLEYNAAKDGYKNDGKFSVRTEIENITEKTFEKARVVVYVTGGLRSLDKEGKEIEASYEKPFYIDLNNFTPKQKQIIDWIFYEPTRPDGTYATISYKVYNMSSDATMKTDTLVSENLMCEGKSYVLIPGLESELPKVKFTGFAPEKVYNQETRYIYLSGDNFSMLSDKSAYNLKMVRRDGSAFSYSINGEEKQDTYFNIPSDNFVINDENNTITIKLDDDVPGTLPVGEYKLIFDYTDASKQDDSGPALEFTVTNERRYQNISYGVLTVRDDNRNYSIEIYDSEDDYVLASEDAVGYDVYSVPLVFKGYFSEDKSASTKTKKVYKAISTGPDDNVIVLNDCLDISEGSVTVTEENGSVTVDFDAKISSGGRSIWNGVCALTKLKQGHEYRLIRYDEEGESTYPGTNANTINLVWPSVGQAAQNLMGFLMKFKYGQLGFVEHEEGDAHPTKVVAFGASMDLGFAIPSFADVPEEEPSARDQAYENALKNGKELNAQQLRDIDQKAGQRDANTYDRDENGKENEDDGGFETPKASVHVDDVLFGEGKFMGVNLTVGIGIPGYVDGMPDMEGELTINTLNNWSAGFEGECDFEVVAFEGELSIRSTDKGVPVPDNIRFYMGNVTPGVNLDPFGILWLQGGGGGISNIYETIFLEDALPPLRLMIEAQISIMQILQARGAIELGLTGFNIEMKDIRVARIGKIMDHAGVAFDWYPEFYLLGDVQMNLLDIIKGGGYMVLEKPYEGASDYFFEFFISAAICIPDDVLIIGGMNVAAVGMGVNKDKIYGLVKALGVKLGVVYYWGDSGVKWSGGEEVMPTHPELTGISTEPSTLGAVPIYYDEEEDRTLYASVGTNFTDDTIYEEDVTGGGIFESEEFVLGDGEDREPLKVNKVTGTAVPSGGMSYDLALCGNQKNKIMLISFEANSKQEAIALVKKADSAITINDENGAPYDLKLMDQSKTVESGANSGTNANLTYDEDSKTASLAVSFTKGLDKDQYYTLVTQMDARVVLYDLEEMPELYASNCSITESDDGKSATLTVGGVGIENFDKICVSVAGIDGEQMIGMITKEEYPDCFEESGGSATFDLPADLSSDTYEVKLAASDNDNKYCSMVENLSLVHKNNEEPVMPAVFTLSNAGDYMLNLMPKDSGNDFDGYEISVFESDGETAVKGLSGLLYNKNGSRVEYDENNLVIIPDDNEMTADGFTFGGHFDYEGDEDVQETQFGLNGGDSYEVRLRKWKKIDASERLLYSSARYLKCTVSTPSKAELSVSAKAESVPVKQEYGDGEVEIPYYGVADPGLTVTADQKISGTWTLDGGAVTEDENGEADTSGLQGSFTDTLSIPIDTGGLAEGIHTLEIKGSNAKGDSTGLTYIFGIDTTAPKILLTEPLSGQFFDHTSGKVVLSGVSEPGTKVNVTEKASGQHYYVTADDTGSFTSSLIFDKNPAQLNLLIYAEDEVGNRGENEVILNSDLLGQLESISLVATNAAGKQIPLGTPEDDLKSGEYSLTLYGNVKDSDAKLNLNTSSITEWDLMSIAGGASLDVADGEVKLAVHEGDTGVVSASLNVHDAGAMNVVSMFGKSASGSISPGGDEPGVDDPDNPDNPGKDDPSKSQGYKQTIYESTQKLADGSPLTLEVLSTRSVSYNNLKHLLEGSKTNNKSVADIKVVTTGPAMTYAMAVVKVKNNKTVPVKVKNGVETPLEAKKQPQILITLKPLKTKADGSSLTKEEKAMIKAFNKEIKQKQKAEPLTFEIKPVDITAAQDVQIKYNGKHTKVSGMTLKVNGVAYKLSKKDFVAEFTAEGTVIKGVGNYTGTYTDKTK